MSNMTGTVIRLRPIEARDAAILCKWKNDEEVYQYLGGGYQPVSPDQYAQWVTNMIDQTGRTRRFIIETLDGRAVGMVGLYDIQWVHRTCEVGIFIGERNDRRSGAASEAYRLLEEYARNYLNLRKITLKVVDDNQKGQSFWLKVGFVRAGVLHAERFINGRYCDLILMEKFIQDEEVRRDI